MIDLSQSSRIRKQHFPNMKQKCQILNNGVRLISIRQRIFIPDSKIPRLFLHMNEYSKKSKIDSLINLIISYN
jgi:hypothetical protein